MNEPHPPAALETLGVSFSYPGSPRGLVSVDFKAAPGQFIALLGENGSGKTTLIKTLVRLIKPVKGEIRIFGKDIQDWAPAELYQRVGAVFQNPDDQLFANTVEEDVAFGPRNLGLSESEVALRVTEALAAVGAASLRDRAIHHLSFGEKKRAAIAGVLAMRPAVMLLDEPTAGLDPAGERLMMDLLGRLNKERGITVILSTHSVDLLPYFAERICVLSQGRVLKEGTPLEIFSDSAMIRTAGLRLPYISSLIEEMKLKDGLPIDRLPLTGSQARRELLKLMPRPTPPNTMGNERTMTATEKRTAVLLIGHGSKDPEGNQEFERFAQKAGVHHCLLEYAEPSIPTAFQRLAEQGVERVAAIPYFLFAGAHVKHDIPREIDEERKKHPSMDIQLGRHLGLDPALLHAMADRLGPVEDHAVLLVGRGSLEPEPIADMAAVARNFAELRGLPFVEHCFIALAPPDLPTGIANCRARGAKRVTVVPYFLLTGVLVKRIERISRELGAQVRPHLGLHQELVEMVHERKDETLALGAFNS